MHVFEILSSHIVLRISLFQEYINYNINLTNTIPDGKFPPGWGSLFKQNPILVLLIILLRKK